MAVDASDDQSDDATQSLHMLPALFSGVDDFAVARSLLLRTPHRPALAPLSSATRLVGHGCPLSQFSIRCLLR